MIDNLDSVNVDQLSQKAIEETAIYGEDAQRDQLFQGLDRDEKKIKNILTGSEHYATRTVIDKIKKGQPVDRITLKDTGDYYAGIKIEVEGDKYRIYSVDEKNDLLDVTYSPLGLGMHARVKWIQKLKPALINEFRKKLSS